MLHGGGKSLTAFLENVPCDFARGIEYEAWIDGRGFFVSEILDRRGYAQEKTSRHSENSTFLMRAYGL